MTSDPLNISQPSTMPLASVAQPIYNSSLVNVAECRSAFFCSDPTPTNISRPPGAPSGNILRRLLCHPSDAPPDVTLDAPAPRIFPTLDNSFPRLPPVSDYRPRSQSMVATYRTIPEIVPSASRDSLDCADDCEIVSVNSGGTILPESARTDQLIEVARRRLMMLQTHCDDDLLTMPDDRLSTSQPGSPPRSAADPYHIDRSRQHRKFSEGSQLKARLQAMRSGFRTPVDPVAVDLSRRNRRKFDGVAGLPYGRRMPGYAASGTSSIDEGIVDDASSDRSSSILKSILTGRGRSNTISGSPCAPVRPEPAAAESSESRLNGRMPVTLAKKNLHPVTSKISECLNRVISFVRSLPEFMGLPPSDQRALMSGALHRLLLLFMAESNVHFVVVPLVQSEGGEISEEGDAASGGSTPVMTPVAEGAADVPTMQFAESVRNFVAKCQALELTAEEFAYMRIITLFQSAGAGVLELSSVVDKLSSAARRDLQLVVERTHPTDSLHRYSSLLLTMHMLYGIHCGMLEALFCRPLTAKTTPSDL